MRRFVIPALVGSVVLVGAGASYRYIAWSLPSVSYDNHIVDTRQSVSPSDWGMIDLTLDEEGQGSLTPSNISWYRLESLKRYSNCTIWEKDLLCNWSKYSYNKKVVQSLIDNLSGQTFSIRFMLARYTDDVPLVMPSLPWMTTIVSWSVYQMTQQWYVGGQRFSNGNTIFVIVWRQPFFAFDEVNHQSTYQKHEIAFSHTLYEKTEYSSILSESYDNGMTTIIQWEMPEIKSWVYYTEDKQYPVSRRLGRERLLWSFALDKVIPIKALSSIHASINDKKVSTSWSWRQLIITSNEDWDFDTDAFVNVEYTLYGVKQSFTVSYKTILPFTASYYQDTRTEYINNTGIIVMTNKTNLHFSQPISGVVLDRILRQTAIPFAIQWYDSGISYTNVSVSRFTDPTKDAKITLTGVTSIYGDALTKMDITLKPFVMDESQHYATIVGSPVALVPRSSPYAYQTQIISKNIKDYNVWMRSCHPARDLTKVIRTLGSEPKQRNEQALTTLLDCEMTKKVSHPTAKFSRWKEYADTFSFDTILGTWKHSMVEVGLQPFEKRRGAIVMTTDIGVYSQLSAKDNTLHRWTHSLASGKAKVGLSYQVGFVTDNKKITVLTGVMKTNTMKVVLSPTMTIGYLHLWEEWKQDVVTSDLVESGSLQVSGAKTIIMKNVVDETIVPIAWSMVNVDSNQRYNTFTTRESYYDQEKRRLFAYSDRVLYKPGEMIHISGRLRQRDGSYKNVPWAKVSIILRDPDGQEIAKKASALVDRFGGIRADVSLPETVPLGMYTVYLSYNDVDYYHTIQVKEFTKPTIFLTTAITNDTAWKSIISVNPRYYFGASLASYDWHADYTISSNYAEDDRFRCHKDPKSYDRCDEPMSFANVHDSFSSWGMVRRDNMTDPSIQMRLTDTITVPSSVVMDLSLTDRQSRETVYKTIVSDLHPAYLVGIKWWSSRWVNGNEDYSVAGVVRVYDATTQSYKDLIKWTVTITVSKYESDTNQTQNVDGEYYYESDGEYKVIKTYTTSLSSDGYRQLIKDFQKSGQYRITVSYDDIYKSEQDITLYGWQSRDDAERYGSLDNSNELSLYVSSKEYDPGDTLTINMDPYIKGATALVLVEKDSKILSSREVILDGKPLSLKVDQSRFPNAHITVVQIVGQDVNKKLNPKRDPEPRVFIGQTTVQLSPQSQSLFVDMAIHNKEGQQKERYSPREDMQIDMTIKDRKGKSIQSRVSVAVVDKSLTDLYDEIKTPLEKFYSRVSDGFHTITNYHIIFKALKVLVEWGEKWGGASDDGSILQPRKEFLNTAFRDAGKITDVHGKVKFNFTLPDNLTTWMVDVVAVGQDGQMGSQRAYFVTSQQYILSVMLSQFIDPGTHIRVPVSVISRDGDSTKALDPQTIRTSLTGSLQIADQKYPLVFGGDTERTYIDLNMADIPRELLINQSSLMITVGMNKDAIQQTIPLRLENTLVRSFITKESTEWSITHKIDSDAKKNRNNNASPIWHDIRISTLPLIDWNAWLQSLLRYPYGCAEQTASSLDGILLAVDLAQKGYVSTWLVMMTGGQWYVHTTDKRSSLDALIRSSLNKIQSYQNSNGLFGYRSNQDQWDVNLSIYILSILKQIDAKTYPQVVAMQTKVSEGLQGRGTTHQQLYKLAMLSMAGEKISMKQIDELVGQKISYQTDVLGFVAKAYQGSVDTALWKRITAIQANNPTLIAEWSRYTARIPLWSMMIQALLYNNRSDLAMPLTRDLMKLVNSDATWGRSSQDNRRGLRAVAARYFQTKQQQVQWKETITVTIDGKSQSITLLSWQRSAQSLLPIDTKKSTISRKTSQTLFVTSMMTWIDPDMTFEQEMQNVRYLQYRGTGVVQRVNDTIGSLETHTFRFQTKTDTTQLAVVATIPAYLRLLQSFDQPSLDVWYDVYDDGWYYDTQPYVDPNISFMHGADAGVSYDCTPTHYEIRYDRLVAFYDSLPAGASCDISFRTAKTHDAAIQPATLSVYEMYDSGTYGRVVERE